MSAAIEKERRHREDLAEASRLGEGFGFGEVKQSARTTVRLALGQLVTGVSLVLAAPVVALSIGLARIPATPKLIVVGASVGAALLGWRLMRGGVRPRAENRLFWYSVGLIQLVHDEPEPRVLRWEDLDSAEIGFDTLSEESHTGLDVCTLHAQTGTEITVRAMTKSSRPITLQLAAEADRRLSSRLLPSMIHAYDAGEPVVLGSVRIDQTGVELGLSREPAIQAPWTDVGGIVIVSDGRSSFGPAASIRIDRTNRRTSLGLAVSGVRNGLLIPHLIEYAASRRGIPVRRTGPGTGTSLSAPAPPPLAAPEDT